MKKQMMKIVGLTLAFSLFFVACNKNDKVSPDDVAVDDNHAILSDTEDAYQLTQEVLGLPFIGLKDTGFQEDKDWQGTHGCATVTKTVASNVVTIVYDLTQVKDGLCNGKKVGGKMTIKLPISIKDFTGTITMSVTYENFLFGNGRTLNGSHAITTSLTSGKVTTSEKLSNMTITNADGKTSTFTSTKTRTKVGDDWQVTGSTSGKTSDGNDFSFNITTPILFKKSCFATSGYFPVSGTVEIKPATKDKEVVDYGSGSCDRDYTVTINGKTETKTAKG